MNKNPSPGTRFKPGNPGRPKAKPKAPVPDPPPSTPPVDVHQQVVSKLMSIVETEADVGHVIRAARLLISEDLAAVIREMEHHERDRAEAEQMTAADLAAVDGLLADWPAMARETAEEFVADLHAAVTERLPTESLTEQLRRRLLGSPEPRLTAAAKDAVIREMYAKYGLDYELPKCGFKELPPPAPAPDPDRAFLAQRAIEDERARRAKLRHPEQVPAAALPAPKLPTEPEPPAAPEPEPELRPEPPRPFLDFGGFTFHPDLGD